jgi:hypothetical protein
VTLVPAGRGGVLEWKYVDDISVKDRRRAAIGPGGQSMRLRARHFAGDGDAEAADLREPRGDDTTTTTNTVKRHE